MSSDSAAGRTYARALLEAAGDDAARVADELDALVELARESHDTWEQLTSPTVSHAVLKETIARVFADASPFTRNVLYVLVDNGRIEDALDVASELRALVKEQSRKLDVHVTTAVEMTPELQSRLAERLSTGTGRTVTIHASVDPSIVGGLVVRHGDTLVDTSLKGRLEQLRLELSRPTASAATS